MDARPRLRKVEESTLFVEDQSHSVIERTQLGFRISVASRILDRGLKGRRISHSEKSSSLDDSPSTLG
jgi:hypothetical protein